ncbi:glycine--tRNA ligase [Candidatus Saccharibacteria bacterium]|nr:glycine--tRNA ligase [Candidatus Saccharibacteria bacterium]MCB9821376.1 glycine--tRNA ligase [Candidatus Nomurabacteria bacterium]
MSEVSLEDIVSLCKRRGFIFQGSEIYGGLAGTWDYGPLGVQLKKNLTDLWWKTFVESREDMVGVDAAILMNPKTWQASGHVDTFTDPLVECTECRGRFRADHLEGSKCPNCGKENTMSEPRAFNMMFKTAVGPVDDGESVSYLRPETAQGIFTNFKNVVDTLYPDVPFGIAQIGKAFRNEISPRDFVFRSREFNQMEIEYFVHENDWQNKFEHWRTDIKAFLAQAGVDTDKVTELEVPEDDLAHYSKRTIDYEFEYPHGKDELLGLAYRTDFDLQNVARESGKNVEYRPKDGGSAYVPHVIEPSFGVERLVMAVLVSNYKVDEQNGEQRVYLSLPEHIAPVRYAVSPLLKNKPELVDKAREVYKMLKTKYGNVMWDDNGNIGKRYRRQDEIGTPYCVVVDFDTIEKDGLVTVRNRDTLEQTRVKPEDI